MSLSTSKHQLSTFLRLACALCFMVTTLCAHVPEWWSEYGVGPEAATQALDTTLDANYQPALLGQAKFMAYQAWQAMDAKEKGSAGPQIEAMVQGFSTDEEDNYQILLLGQLKAILQPFYQRFSDRSYDLSVFDIALTSTDYPYPWIDPDTPDYEIDINYQPANIGQLKYLFSFGLQEWGLKPSFTLDELSSLDGNPATDEIEVATLSITLGGTIDTTNFGRFSVNEVAIDSITAAGPFTVNQALQREGENTLTLVLEDQSGNSVEQIVTIYRITQAPSLFVSTPGPGIHYTRQSAFEIVGTVGLSATTFTINNAPVTTSDDGSFRHIVSLNEGENVFTLTATDALANTQSIERRVILDTAPPTISEPTLTDGTITNMPTLSYGGSFGEDGALYVNGDQVTLSEDGDRLFDHEIQLVEGENTITIRRQDTLGNAATETLQIILDLTPPQLAIEGPANGFQTNANTITLTGTTDDATAAITVNGTPVTTSEGTFVSDLPLTEGENTFVVVATDPAGNVTESTLSVIRDTQASEFLTLDPAADIATALSTQLLSGTVDDTAAVVQITFGAETIVLPVDPETAAFAAELTLAAGVNTVTLTATDPAGNVTAQTINLTLDQSTPAPALINAPTHIASDRIQISGMAEPGASIAITGGLATVSAVADATGAFTTAPILLQPNQPNDLILRATDPLGNRAELAYRVIADTRAPVIALQTPADGAALTETQVAIVGTISDANPGASVSINGTDLALRPDGRFASVISLPAGLHTITVESTDLAGNSAAPLTHAFTVETPAEDTTAPTVSVLSPAYDASVNDPSVILEIFLSDASGIASVSVNGIQADLSSLADGFLQVPAVASSEGEFLLSVTDRATPANTATLTHRVDINALVPTVPVIRLVTPASPTNADAVSIYATIDPDLSYALTGGLLASVEGTAAANGQLTAVVPLQQNERNTLTLTAIGGNGLTSSIEIEVVQDNVAPVVTTITPANNATGVELSDAVVVHFAEPIAPIAASAIELVQDGQAVTFTIDLSEDAQSLTVQAVDPFDELAQITLNLPETLTDLAGNPLTGARTVTFTTKDTVAPDAPSGLTAGRTRTNLLQVQIFGTAEPNSTVTVSGGSATVSTTTDASGIFTVEIPLTPNTLNALSATATDLSGNQSLAATIEIDHIDTPLQLLAVTPDATDALIDSTVEFTFNRNLDLDTISGIALLGDGLGVIESALTAGSTPESVILTPLADLAHGVAYEVIVPLSVRDLYGNALAAPASAGFSTVEAAAPAAPIIYSSFPEDLTNQTEITINAFATPGTVVTITGGSAVVTHPESGVIDDTGEFTVQVPLTLDQENILTLTTAEPSGNPSPASVPVVITQDATAPTVGSVSPTGSEVSVTETVSITFSEGIDLAGLTSSPAAVRILDGVNSRVAGSWFPSTDQSTITYYPSRNLDPATNYTIVIDGNLRDLAGNAIAAAETHTFTTAAAEADTSLLAAPTLDPLGFERTALPTITLRGTAEPGATLYVLGARSDVVTTVGADGSFAVNVPLIQDAQNQLVAYVEDAQGVPGLPATVALIHNSRPTGIRILSPKPELEYNNRSVMIAGILDNAAEFTRVVMRTDANGTMVEEEVALIGQYFGRQFVRDGYEVILSTSGLPGSGNRQLVVAEEAGVLQFRFFDRSGASTDYSEDVFPEQSESMTELRDIMQPLWGTEPIDATIARSIESRITAITGHSIDEGTCTVTILGETIDGTTLETSVTFSLYIQPEGFDTRAPLVTFLSPEPGETIAEDIVETFLVVEEGVLLSEVEIGGVVAHNMLGNFFFIYAAPQEQGSHILTARAVDYVGNQGSAQVEVFFDTISVADPTIDPVASVLPERDTPVVSGRVLTLSGSGEVGSIIRVENGLAPVQVVVAADGVWSLKVPLVDNTTNHLSITASDAVGNRTEAQTVSVVHDDTAPVPTGSIPSNGQIGVAPDGSIAVTFSEPLAPTSVSTDSVKLSRINPEIAGGAKTAIADYNVLLSADGRTITILPDFKFFRAETIVVDLLTTLEDVNAYPMENPYSLSFNTALYQTTLSGVVVDSTIRPLQNVRVGIRDSDTYAYTSSFGTFVLDEVPLGEQILYIDARPDGSTGIPPQGDARVFNYLEFPVYIEENTDNSIGRPVFMVDTDFATATRLTELPDGTNTLQFTSDRSDLDGFEIIYESGAARFADGTDRGEITVTRIDPAHIPDRLPDGAIPHFMVEIGPDDLSFATPVALRFPNAYDLQSGDEVIVFHFKHGLADYKELTRITLGDDLLIETTPVLAESGFVGIVPVGDSFDLTRAYLEGRVVDGNGLGIAGVSVNAIAGTAYVLTDAEGYYRIPLPDVRVILIQTFATLPTGSLGIGEAAPDLVYPSELVELAVSGTTSVPDIVIDSFTLEGSLRYLGNDGSRIGLTGFATTPTGHVVSIDPAHAKAVDIFIYRRLESASDVTIYDSAPYMRAVADLDTLIDDTYDASFSMTFLGSLDEAAAETDSPAPKPGDIIKVVAFDSRTGFYGETEIELAAPAAGGVGLLTSIDLRPPQLELDMNRVFFIDSVRRRANIPNKGTVFVDDEFVEFKTTWRTVDVVPLARAELSLPARLRVDSIDYKTDYNFRVTGGEQFRVLEIRESLYPSRLDVLQRETDVGRETLTVSRNGSFRDDSRIPITVRTGAYGIAQSQAGSVSIADSITQEVLINVVELTATALDDGQTAISGRTLPGERLTVGGVDFIADFDGFFGDNIDETLGEGGITVETAGGLPTRYGASLTPVITALDPQRGSQGDTITLTGEYFSTQLSENKVNFNGALAVVTSATEDTLTVLVPGEASSGDVTVTVAGKVSNGVPFEFISEGINNGSFEAGFFRGFTLEGEGVVVEKLRTLEPTDRLFMAFLNTSSDPVNGRTTLTTDRFTVPSTLPNLAFDFNLMGTAVFSSLDNYIDVYLIVSEGEPQLLSPTGIDSSLERHTYSSFSGFNKGTGFQTVGVDLSAYAGTETEVRIQIVLKARGGLPPIISGMRPDDENAIDITKRQGTGLLLDNLRLSGSGGLATIIDETALSRLPVDANTFRFSAPANTVPSEARVFISDQLTGVQSKIDANIDGSFSATFPIIDPTATGHYLINYATQNTALPESDSLFSPSVKVFVDYDSLQN